MEFYKMDGAGNDFVVVDNRDGRISLTEKEIALMCHRRLGIGADGLMTLDPAAGNYDFTMRYYNSDGRLGSMCGNGGRCIAFLANILGMGERVRFTAYDGPHEATVTPDHPNGRKAIVALSMQDVRKESIRHIANGIYLDTGSPHFVLEVNDLNNYNVVGCGKELRNRKDLFPHGANIDFVEQGPDGVWRMRTYERGVEDETLACGTGVTAVALTLQCHRVDTRLAHFNVDYESLTESFHNIVLTGPASLNFTGRWPL